MEVKLTIPSDLQSTNPAGSRIVQYGQVHWLVNDDGTVDVPSWAVEELLTKGFTLPGSQQRKALGEAPAFDTAKELAEANDGELHAFLNAHGETEITFDKFTHVHSEWLRQKGKETPEIVRVVTMENGKEKILEEERFTAVAEHLDTYHRALHMKSQGRIVVQPPEKVREFALALHHGKKNGKKVPCPWAKSRDVVETQPETAADLAKALREKKK